METTETTKIAGIVAPPPLIFGIPLIVGVLLDRWHPLPFLAPQLAPWIGIPFCVGFLVGLLAIAAFRRASTSANPWRPSTALVTGGPFRFTRNPMYLGMLLLYVGVTCWVNTLWPVAFLPFVLALMHFGVITREEAYLETLFGAEYRDYRARVRRWI